MVNKVTRDWVLTCSKLAAYVDYFVDWFSTQLQEDQLVGEWELTPNDTKPFNDKNEVLDTCHKASQFEDVRGDDEERPLFFTMGDRQEPYILSDMADALGVYDYEDNIKVPYVHPTLLFEGSPDGMGRATANKEDILVIEPHTKGHVTVFTPNNLPLEVKGCGVLEAKYQHYGSQRDDCPLTLGRLQAQGLCECADFDWYAVGVQYGNSATHVFVYPRNPLFKVWLEQLVNDFNKRLETLDWYAPINSLGADFIYPTADDTILDLTDNQEIDNLIEEDKVMGRIIKSTTEAKDGVQTRIKILMQENKHAHTPQHQIEWGQRVMKAKPERTKTIPATEEKTIRNKTIKIKERQIND